MKTAVLIQRSGGRLTDQSKSDLGAALQPLPDGDYSIIISSDEDTPGKIAQLVTEYHALPADFMDIQHLLNLRKSLACLRVFFAEELGALYTDKAGSEHRRKSKFARRRQELIAQDMSGVKAEVQAEVDCEEERKDESVSDAAYRAAYLLYDSSGAVLDTMTQHIANLRSEKSLETRGQGSQG